MRILRNLTLHYQGDREVALAAARGLDLMREPEGVNVAPGQQGLRNASRELVARLRECRRKGEAVLLGGHTGLWVAAIAHIITQGEALPDLYYFDTRRVQDAEGRFVFEPEDLVRLEW
jgi:hypothetical protein